MARRFNYFYVFALLFVKGGGFPCPEESEVTDPSNQILFGPTSLPPPMTPSTTTTAPATEKPHTVLSTAPQSKRVEIQHQDFVKWDGVRVEWSVGALHLSTIDASDKIDRALDILDRTMIKSINILDKALDRFDAALEKALKSFEATMFHFCWLITVLATFTVANVWGIVYFLASRSLKESLCFVSRQKRKRNTKRKRKNKRNFKVYLK